MNKKWFVISTILIFALSSIFHFVYQWFPNTIVGFFFPVNESIWEHNKIILLSFFVIAIIEKIKYKEKNVFTARFLSSLSCMVLVMLIFTPIFLYILKTKDNMLISLIVFIFSIIISQFINNKVLKSEYSKEKEFIFLVSYIVIFIFMAILTLFPFKNKIFYDFSKEIYGRY